MIQDSTSVVPVKIRDPINVVPIKIRDPSSTLPAFSPKYSGPDSNTQLSSHLMYILLS
jgi:hypothetical protein